MLICSRGENNGKIINTIIVAIFHLLLVFKDD